MKLVRYIAFFLCSMIAARSYAQIEIASTMSVVFYDSAFSAKSVHTAYFKLFNVEPDGSIVADNQNVPVDPKTATHIMDSLYRDAKHIKVIRNATDTMILTVDKRLVPMDGGNFQYRVKMDGKVIIDWKPMDFSERNKVSGSDYMLVKGPLKDHKYVIDIKTVAGKDVAQVVSFNYPTPAIWGVFFPEQKDDLYRATNFGMADSFDYYKLPKVPWEKYDNKGGYDTMGVMPSFITRLLPAKDIQVSGNIKKAAYIMPSHLNVPHDYNDLLFLLGPIADTQYYEYCLVNDKDIKDTVLKWTKNPLGNAIIELKGLDAGEYRLYVRYGGATHSCVYYFTLRSLNWRSFLMGFLVGIGISVLPAIAFKYVRKQKRKNKEMQHKMTALQLQSYRAQLNPHFIFNALSSIQSLVNRDDKEQANKYLIEFSTLLRATLDRQGEFWTLHDEADLLQKYIRLEQLRFQFRFEMETDKNIPTENIEFPSMLLQPVVENAIKHGIAARYEEGRLNIRIAAQVGDLIITITDNGKGFDPQDIKSSSKGIALTQERIALLNEQNKERMIKLDISSNSQGTTATFYLYHYLHNG